MTDMSPSTFFGLGALLGGAVGFLIAAFQRHNPSLFAFGGFVIGGILARLLWNSGTFRP